MRCLQKSVYVHFYKRKRLSLVFVTGTFLVKLFKNLFLFFSGETSLSLSSGRNSRSTDLTSQVLPFVCPEFSVIIEMTSHFLSSTTRKEIVRDALKALEINWTIFKRMPSFFTVIITTLRSVHIQRHRPIASLLLDIKS